MTAGKYKPILKVAKSQTKGHFKIIFSLMFLGTKSKRIVSLWTSPWLAIVISHCKMWGRFAPRITRLPTFISVTKNLERRKSAFVVKALQNYCFVRGFGSDWTRFEYRLSAPGRNNKFWLLIWDACSSHVEQLYVTMMNWVWVDLIVYKRNQRFYLVCRN